MADQDQILTLRDNAKAQLMEIKTVESGIEYLNKLKAIEVWVKAEKKDGELQNIVAEQKIRTQRILGNLIIDGQKKGEISTSNNNNGSFTAVTSNDRRSLSDIGITKNESSAFKAIAEIPEEIFEQEIAIKKDAVTKAVGELTTSGMLQLAKVYKKKESVSSKEQQYKEEIKNVDEFEVDIHNTDKKFTIIYADPPWRYWENGEKNQQLHYPTLTIDEICELPVNNIADANSILFMWVTFPILPEALQVISAWGFDYSTAGFVWVKKNKISDSWFFGNGSWTRANAELCLIATKGTVHRMNAGISQIIDDRIAEHSQKPERVRSLITQLVGELPRIELFSRNQNKDGWFNWGNKI